MYTALYCILYISPPSNLSGLSCQTQDPATNWNALSLSVTGVFQFPRPVQQGPQSPFHHNITSKDWHQPQHRCSCWQLPFYLIKKTFYKFPWKLENSNCLVTDKRWGRKGNACQKLVLKLASDLRPVTINCGLRLTTGGLMLFMKSGDLGPGESWELGPDFPVLRAGLITCH